MTKWADFVITAVRYNSDNTHITQVQRYEDLGDKLTNMRPKNRNVIINAIKDNRSYITATKKDGKWVKGSPVRIIEINGTEYIKTENNQTARDNLENLPEF